ncbi:MAG: hypothetical protein NTU65_09310, partial [Cyanobacteria bacterium]|nr:hypothetical protein [Cyanobacteriota bacterium]
MPAPTDRDVAHQDFAENPVAESDGAPGSASAGAELAPPALLARLAGIEGMGPGRRRLVVLLPQLGDFDSL